MPSQPSTKPQHATRLLPGALRTAVRNLSPRDSTKNETVSQHDEPTDVLSYVHKPLDLTSDRIRLLRIHPASRSGRIHIDIREGSTSDQYICLSYTWGDPTENFEISVDGRLMSVRSNLYHFLQMASRRYSNLSLWIDAICINQNDTKEKNHQVRRMSQIYRNAEKVLVWLGMTPKADMLFSMAKVWHAASRYRPLHILYYRLRGILFRIPFFDKHVKRLSYNAYWTRTWVIQEVFLARSIEVVNGENRMPFERLSTLLLPLHGHRGFEESPFAKYMSPLYWHADFWMMLDTFADTACADRRDHVYAFLGTVDKEASFQVDYNEDVCSLFWRAGEYFEAWVDDGRTQALLKALDLTVEKLREDLAGGSRSSTVLRLPHLSRPLGGLIQESLTCSQCRRYIKTNRIYDLLSCSVTSIYQPNSEDKITREFHTLLSLEADNSLSVILNPEWWTPWGSKSFGGTQRVKLHKDAFVRRPIHANESWTPLRRRRSIKKLIDLDAYEYGITLPVDVILKSPLTKPQHSLMNGRHSGTSIKKSRSTGFHTSGFGTITEV